MGCIRTKTIKKTSRQVIEKYYSRVTVDFHTIKKVLEDVSILSSKRLRNKVAGFTTDLRRCMQCGPVRGISLKLLEEERERRMDFVPEKLVLEVEQILVDQETMEMRTSLGKGDLPGIKKTAEVSSSIPAFNRPQYGAPHRT